MSDTPRTVRVFDIHLPKYFGVSFLTFEIDRDEYFYTLSFQFHHFGIYFYFLNKEFILYYKHIKLFFSSKKGDRK